MMKVSELIAALEHENQEREVVVFDSEYDELWSVTGVDNVNGNRQHYVTSTDEKTIGDVLVLKVL